MNERSERNMERNLNRAGKFDSSIYMTWRRLRMRQRQEATEKVKLSILKNNIDVVPIYNCAGAVNLRWNSAKVNTCAFISRSISAVTEGYYPPITASDVHDWKKKRSIFLQKANEQADHLAVRSHRCYVQKHLRDTRSRWCVIILLGRSTLNAVSWNSHDRQ